MIESIWQSWLPCLFVKILCWYWKDSVGIHYSVWTLRFRGALSLAEQIAPIGCNRKLEALLVLKQIGSLLAVRPPNDMGRFHYLHQTLGFSRHLILRQTPNKGPQITRKNAQWTLHHWLNAWFWRRKTLSQESGSIFLSVGIRRKLQNKDIQEIIQTKVILNFQTLGLVWIA